MGHTPELPDGTPQEVNGYTYDPGPYNGNAWFGDDGRVAVHVQPSIGRETATAKVHDERVNWGGKQYITAPGFVDDLADERKHDTLPDDPDPVEDTYEEVVETAVEWMRTYDAADWQHPQVTEAVFDPPEGYGLRMYQVTARRTDVVYRLEDPPGRADVLEVELESFTRTHNLTINRFGGRQRVPRKEERDLAASDFEAALLEVREIAQSLRGDEGRERPSGQTKLEGFDQSRVPNP